MTAPERIYTSTANERCGHWFDCWAGPEEGRAVYYREDVVRQMMRKAFDKGSSDATAQDWGNEPVDRNEVVDQIIKERFNA